MASPAGGTIVDLGQIIATAILLVSLGLLIGVPVWIMRRASTLHSAQSAEEAAFERETMAAMRGVVPPASAPPIRPSPAPAPALTPEPAKPAQAAAPPSPTESGGPGWAVSPLARSVMEKLEVAGATPSLEGPIRTANPAIHGSLITIKGNRRIGILDSPLDRDDPALGMLMRHVDALVVAGPEGEPLLVKRFQSLIGDLFSLS
jgi:hypothetical protein